jgi:hypothetical protein
MEVSMLSALLLSAALAAQIPDWETDIGYPPFSSPLLALNERGSMDIFVSMGDHGLGGWSADGTMLPGFPISADEGVSRRPASMYTRDHGWAVIYADNSGTVHAVDHMGYELPGWPVPQESPVVTGISVVNLDDNDITEIAFGTSDGRIHMLDGRGRPVQGWPVILPARLQWQPSQLSLGGNSGYGLLCGLVNKTLYVIDPEGSILPGWPITTGFTLGSVPVSADLDSDGLGDAVFATNNDRVYALNSSGGTIEGWPFFLDDRVSGGGIAIGRLGGEGANLQVAVATIDGNVTLLRGSGRIAGTWKWPNLTRGLPTSPVIAYAGGSTAVIAGCDSGYVYAWDALGESVAGFPMDFGEAVSRTPAAGDIDGDGGLELIILGRSGKLGCYSVTGGYGPEILWPQLLCDEFNSGCYGTSDLPVLQAGTIGSEASGEVVLPYGVEGGRVTSVSLAYSVNAGYSWTETTDFADNGNSISWFSESDLAGRDIGECALKITPYCPSGPGISGISNVFHLDNNTPPSLFLSTLEEESSGRFLIFYSVEDPESDIIQLQAQYSPDDGGTWRNARLSGSTLEIPAWLYGDPVRWNASAEEGVGDLERVLLRMRAADADPGPWSQTGILGGLQNPSVAQIIVPMEEVSGRVRLGVRLSDSKNDPLSYRWEYSVDGGENWEPATVMESSVPSTGNYHYDIFWSSETDLPGIDAASVRFRASPPDSGAGVSVSSSPFHVDNNLPPVLNVNSPGRWDHFRGPIPVSFEISDSEGDSILMVLEYKIEGTSSWVPAGGLIPSGYYPHSTFRSSLTWNSSEDLPGTERIELRIKLGAVDGDTVFTQEIGPISVDNTRLPSVMQAAVREIMQSSRQADIAYELSDPGGRSLDLMVTYSTDGGTSWLDATVNGDIFGRNSAIYQGSFIWDFGRDLEGLRGGNPGDAAFLKITPVSDDLMGTPKILQIDLR